MSDQLRFDGTPAPSGAPVKQAPFTRAQREIIERMRRQGFIRSTEAGEIVHFYRSRRRTWPDYYASDGGDAMKRLVARGVVRRGDERGLWLLVDDEGAAA